MSIHPRRHRRLRRWRLPAPTNRKVDRAAEAATAPRYDEGLGAITAPDRVGRALPVTRWVALTPDWDAYYFWQHERLGWWAWSAAFARDGQPVRWRPIVAPLMLVVQSEGLALTFCDWPRTGLERHDWLHEVGRIASVRINPRAGWPGEPPVAVLLAEVG